ncbi:sensor histidine kinase [Actinoplanes sp. URMC 104]|uniref:sensor histidine kinase n=1 Tax=Actinoplanes sp. URMC 104 TaxID=3423409 RepID=UPI003F1E0EE0
MPATLYLIVMGAVLAAAVLLAVRAARHSGARPSAPRPPDAETPAALAEARSELAAARAEIERLRQAQAQTAKAVGVPAARAGGRRVEVFVNLSRRLQSLVHREIKLLDGLENEVEDPDLLKGLFQVDHLATRIRRHAENLAVLGGSVSRRQWSRPVALTEVLRSAIAEVEHYSRVKLVPPIDGTLPGHAVASVIHLIAELIENATMFAPPHTQVLLRAQPVAAGMAVEVEDRGLGMQRADLDRVNQLLANPDDTDLDDLLRDGRIGLYVVSMIARQHGIVVQLQTNIYGGTQAVIILPPQLVGTAPEPEPEASRPPSLPRAPEQVPARALPPLERRVPQQSVWPAAAPARATPADVSADTVFLPRAGRGQAEARPVATATVPEQPTRATPARPPLPRRRRQTHMAPQLQLGPPQPAAEPAEDHRPGLMASFMSGVSEGEADGPLPDRHG